MMSALTRKHAEAQRLLETYRLHKDSPDEALRRKVHLDLDKFLMENRETAIICVEQILAHEIATLVEERKRQQRPVWYKRVAAKLPRRFAKGGVIADDISATTPARDA